MIQTGSKLYDASSCVVKCRTCDHEVVSLNPAHSLCVPLPMPCRLSEAG